MFLCILSTLSKMSRYLCLPKRSSKCHIHISVYPLLPAYNQILFVRIVLSVDSRIWIQQLSPNLLMPQTLPLAIQGFYEKSYCQLKILLVTRSNIISWSTQKYCSAWPRLSSSQGRSLNLLSTPPTKQTFKALPGNV